MKPHLKLLIALLLGMILGLLFHGYSDVPWLNFVNSQIFNSVGQIFLRLIFMIVVPMVFSALVLGVYELAQSHGLGQTAGKTLMYTLVTSSASVVIGITLVSLLRPGADLQLEGFQKDTQQVQAIEANVQKAKPVAQSIIEIIPKNPLESATRALDGEMIALMFFALMFGVALSSTHKLTKTSTSIIAVFEQIFAACMKIVEYAMRLAPYAVFCLVFGTAFKFGHNIFVSLLYYVLVVVIGLLIQQFVVYGLMLKSAGHSPVQFMRGCREVFMYAFATASSNATLPKSIDAAENILKVPPQIARFVLTVGSTANQNGTALFEGVTVLFLAQVYGVDLSIAQQIQVVLMSILAGIGTAGIPGGSLPLIMILLQQVNIPVEGMALVLGVDRFLDMCRTTINVSGDLVIAKLVGGKVKARA